MPPLDAERPRRLQHLLSLQASLRPESTALWWQGETTSYRELALAAQRLARRLAAIGEPGERIAVLAWNCPEFLHLIYAAPAAGRILVPLNARLAPAELIYQLRSSGATTLFAEPALLAPLLAHPDAPPDLQLVPLDAGFADWVHDGPEAPLPTTRADDPVWILYTSGTTGRPKGAVLTHASFLSGLRSAALGRPVNKSDRYLYPFPLFHVAAHNVLLQHHHGAAVVLVKSFDAAETLRCCRDLQVTTLSLAPTMIAMLLDHPDFAAADLASVRSIGYGASNMPADLLRRLLAQADIDLCQSYGMTELSGSVSFLTPEDHRAAAAGHPALLASVGRPLPTARVRLADDRGNDSAPGIAGEILVQAEQCMQGYWAQPEATAAAIRNGWLHTGDIGQFDDQGYLYIIDRKKDMILSGGENVASREVEDVLRQHPAIRDCAVIGLPDEKWGEIVCAVVVLREVATDTELEQHCRQQLAGYKTPRHWSRMEALPVNAGGKVDKASLRLRAEPPVPTGD